MNLVYLFLLAFVILLAEESIQESLIHSIRSPYKDSITVYIHLNIVPDRIFVVLTEINAFPFTMEDMAGIPGNNILRPTPGDVKPTTKRQTHIHCGKIEIARHSVLRGVLVDCSVDGRVCVGEAIIAASEGVIR